MKVHNENIFIPRTSENVAFRNASSFSLDRLPWSLHKPWSLNIIEVPLLRSTPACKVLDSIAMYETNRVEIFDPDSNENYRLRRPEIPTREEWQRVEAGREKMGEKKQATVFIARSAE